MTINIMPKTTNWKWKNRVHSQYRNKIFSKPCTLIVILNHSEFNKHTTTIHPDHQLFFMATTSRKKLLIMNYKTFITIVGTTRISQIDAHQIEKKWDKPFYVQIEVKKNIIIINHTFNNSELKWGKKICDLKSIKFWCPKIFHFNGLYHNSLVAVENP